MAHMDQFRHSSGRRAVTLQDVAAAAGVSASAASVVLNGGNSGTRVSVPTRRKVMEIASRLGYRPNEVARSLVTGRSNRIGIYSGRSQLDSRNPFFAEVLGGVFREADQFGLDTVVHTAYKNEARLLDLVRGHSIDGLIVHASGGDPILGLLEDLLIPAVAIADKTEGLPCVKVDDQAGGTSLGQHLASQGHRHVLIIQAPFPAESATARTLSFAETCERLGVRVSWTVEALDGSGELNAEDLRILTEGPERATALMGWSDRVAELACCYLKSVGLATPQTVAVVGFDGFYKPYTPRFNLTTIKAPWADVGQTAVRRLTTLFEGSSVPVLTTLPVTFYHGNTT
jgi:LacI family transcriptional regulator